MLRKRKKIEMGPTTGAEENPKQGKKETETVSKCTENNTEPCKVAVSSEANLSAQSFEVKRFSVSSRSHLFFFPSPLFNQPNRVFSFSTSNSVSIISVEFELGMSNGSREDRDQKNRQCQQQASHLLQAQNRLVQEGSRTLHSLWLRGCRHSVFEHWQALWVFQFRVRLLLFNTPLHVLLLFTIPFCPLTFFLLSTLKN